jgi:GT2 family glycosyltransferase
MRPETATESGRVNPSTVSVSVVITTWRRAAWLDRCLLAITRQSTLPDQVLVVGRRDDPDAKAVSRAAGKGAPYPVQWLEVDRTGHIAPVARGLEGAAGEIVAFLDDDTEPEPGWLDALLEAFTDDHIGCVGGRVVTPGHEGRVARDAGDVRWYGQHSANVSSREGPTPVRVDGVRECNWAWRKSVMTKLDFDPVLDFDDATMYGLDLCLQAARHGYRTIYQPSARVAHHLAPRDPGLDRANRLGRVRAYSRNYTYLSLKHMSPARKALYLAWSSLIGERGSYGLALVPVELLSGRRDVMAMARESFKGKWEGIQAWRRRSRP